MHTRKVLALSFAAMFALLAGCGEDDGATQRSQPAETETPTGTETETVASTVTAQPDPVVVTATDYAFDLPASFAGGLVSMELVNNGREPHFAAFARPVEGKTTEDVRAALNGGAEGAAAPAGPPPFVEFAALGTVDPGGVSRMTVNLPAGPYVMFCALPSPQGQTHNLLGMTVDVEVTEGKVASLPETLATVPVADFAIGAIPEMTEGTHQLTLENRGKQIHEIDLVEVAEGKTMEDAATWAASPSGPPPFRFLGGPAVRDGLSAVGTFDLKAGIRYAFVCIVPDSLSDFVPHLAKGMYTPVFEVKPS